MSAFYLHMMFLDLMCVLVVWAVVVARKRGEGWFPKHRLLTIIGVISGIIGFTIMFYSKVEFGRPHFKTPHAIGGGIALLLLIVTPLLGFLAVKGKDALRPVHRVLGRIAAVLALLALTSGAFYLLKNLGLLK